MGWVSITSNQPIAVTVEEWSTINSRAAAYDGNAPQNTFFLVPRQEKGVNGWTSNTRLLNPGAANASLTANFFGSDGTLIWSESHVIPPGDILDLILDNNPNIPVGFDGGLEVVSNQPLIVLSTYFSYIDKYGSDAYAVNPGILQGNVTNHISLPHIAHDVANKVSTQFSIQNAAQSPASVSLTISFYNQSGNLSTQIGDLIPYHGIHRYSTENVNQLGPNWEGSITISSNQPIAAEAIQVHDIDNFITGYVIDSNNNPVSNVIISYTPALTSTTDIDGYYHICGLPANTYTLIPSKNGLTFYPAAREITLPPSAINQDFTVPAPFLDIPLNYNNFYEALLGNTSGTSPGSPGMVNSWFDHNLPNYGDNNYVQTWESDYHGHLPSNNCRTGVNCYDGHDGLDFQRNQENEPVYAAAPGIISEVCRNNPCSRGASLGKYVLVDHPNGYATLYAHLKSINENFYVGTWISDPRNPSNSIGVMGGTPNWPVHLHFTLFYDKNSDHHWTTDEVVDPYGWRQSESDPWKDTSQVTSRWMWIHPPMSQQVGDISGTQFSSPSGAISATIPPGALATTVTLELWDTPPVAEPSAQLRTAGQGFLFQVLEWLNSSNNKLVNESSKWRSAPSDFQKPVTLQVNYDPDAIVHLDEAQLTINQFDAVSNSWISLPTTVDVDNHQASTQTMDIGDFDLQAPLLCSADRQEPDDSDSSSRLLSINGETTDDLFDVQQDQDWFQLNAIAGWKYVIQTQNLAPGVDTVLSLYDIDGSTLLISDDNSGGGLASKLVWQAPMSGTYFIRVTRVASSLYGCNATYQIVGLGRGELFLPFIVQR